MLVELYCRNKLVAPKAFHLHACINHFLESCKKLVVLEWYLNGGTKLGSLWIPQEEHILLLWGVNLDFTADWKETIITSYFTHSWVPSGLWMASSLGCWGTVVLDSPTSLTYIHRWSISAHTCLFSLIMFLSITRTTPISIGAIFIKTFISSMLSDYLVSLSVRAFLSTFILLFVYIIF